MAAFWKALAGGLLLALSLLGRPAESDKSGTSAMRGGNLRRGEKFMSLRSPHSIKSSFQLRTFDPEGTIFYGDTKRGEDWFVLSLKDGVALMQINQLGMLISVTGGPKLNDGKWHTLEVSNQGKFVILEVDGSDRLVVGMQNEHPEEIIQGDLRLALGGILINKDKLIVEYEPQMDGCVRDGVWLNLSIPWETEADRLWPCYQDIQPGSYFPGTGFAVFNTSGGNNIKIKLKGEFNQMDGTILSIKAPGQEMMFTSVVNNNTKVCTLKYKKKKKKSVLVYEICSVDNNTDNDDKNNMKCFSPKNIGSVANSRVTVKLDLSGESEGSQFLSGCLKSIQVQGKDLDLDLAHKHMSVSSHSCPA
uniref:Sex hormone-binding globulin n=1 Tax=Salarias fasciatus TaxID=181472 RepID=A0A672G1K6_SALFA